LLPLIHRQFNSGTHVFSRQHFLFLRSVPTPLPIPNLRHILAVPGDILLVLDEPPLIVRMRGLAGFMDDSFIILQIASV
jgi:hypothetical protein